MPAYVKIGDIKGESARDQDSFVFEPNDTETESQLKYELRDVMISSYSFGGAGGGEAGDGFAFRADPPGPDPDPAALLLPAIQSAREAADDGDHRDWIDILGVGNATDHAARPEEVPVVADDTDWTF